MVYGIVLLALYLVLYPTSVVEAVGVLSVLHSNYYFASTRGGRRTVAFAKNFSLVVARGTGTGVGVRVYGAPLSISLSNLE